MYFRIEYSNGEDCRCDDMFYVEAKDLFEAEGYAENNLNDYVSDYAYFCIGERCDYETEEEYEEAYEEYQANCTYEIYEITKEEYEENVVYKE